MVYIIHLEEDYHNLNFPGGRRQDSAGGSTLACLEVCFPEEYGNMFLTS